MTKLLHRLKRIFGIEEFEFDEPEDEKTRFSRIKNEAEAGKEDAQHYVNRKMTNTDPIYGDGLRKMYMLYSQGGWSLILNHLAGKNESKK